MKKHVLIMLVAAVLTTQAAYGMEEKPKNKEKKETVENKWIPVVFGGKSIEGKQVGLPDYDKPKWIEKIEIHTEEAALSMHIYAYTSNFNELLDSLKGLLKKLQKQVKFTMVQLYETYRAFKNEKMKKDFFLILGKTVYSSSKFIQNCFYCTCKTDPILIPKENDL